MDPAQKFSPMPPQPLRERVSGSSDEDWFDKSGLLTVDEWSRALASLSLSFGDFQTIVDFGCGCGRALRHLRHKMKEEQRLIGLDPDKAAIDWLAENLPDVTVYTLGELPPTEAVASGAADLILSHSVFTHLPEDVQFAWLSELARILKPGGILIASIHGRKVVEEYARSLITLGMPDQSTHFSTSMGTDHFYHVIGKNAYEDALPSYYGAAFHDISYICNHWTKDFEVYAWFPTFALKHQDVLILGRR
jgi:SAM-dependent methyltransferase